MNDFEDDESIPNEILENKKSLVNVIPCWPTQTNCLITNKGRVKSKDLKKFNTKASSERLNILQLMEKEATKTKIGDPKLVQEFSFKSPQINLSEFKINDDQKLWNYESARYFSIKKISKSKAKKSKVYRM